MRIHTDKLTSRDLYQAATHAGGGDYQTSPVRVDVTERGSRKRARAWDVKLTGTSTRRPNDRGASRDQDLYAATWDEWGMFLAELFRRDPDAVVPGVYHSSEHFHSVTNDRFVTLTPENQHGGPGHKWESGGTVSYAGRVAYIQTCATCDAEFWRGA